MLKSLALLLLTLGLLAHPAVAQTEAHGDMQMKMKQGASPSPADHAYLEAMTKMSQAMAAMEMTGDPTRDFALMMIPHHQSAIDMANALLGSPDVDPEIKALAEAVVGSQAKEIEQLRSWLDRQEP
ncbi:MAG TPA: DUF305 domain-containing protein [Aestuariivirgaceae bacterium]|nr:DUF305 domain-containing protein [Aestuariivirgaceae bacterium]